MVDDPLSRAFGQQELGDVLTDPDFYDRPTMQRLAGKVFKGRTPFGRALGLGSFLLPAVSRKVDDFKTTINPADIKKITDETGLVGKDAVEEAVANVVKPLRKLSPYEEALKKSNSPWQTVEHKTIYDKLDKLEKGTEINVSSLAKELDKPRASVAKIIKEYYPDIKILSPGQASKKVTETTLESKRAVKLAEEVKIPTVVRQVDRSDGYKETLLTKWPNEKIKKDYIADLIKKYNEPHSRSKITNRYLAETYLGSGGKKNISEVERINKLLVDELKLTFADPKGRKALYHTNEVIKDSTFGNQVYGKASKFLKDKMYYKKINRNGKEVNITELHKGHPLQKDFLEDPNFPKEFIEAVKRPTFYTTRPRNIKLHKNLENELIPLIKKNDELKLKLNKLGENKKTGTQGFRRTANEIQKLEDKIDGIANQLNDYGLVVLYPSFGKLKQYGKSYDNLTQLYKDYKIRKLGGEEIYKQGGRVGYKEGGSVKPKINPADYIEYYSDGTKLYKINSFIRDVANNKIL